MKNTLKYIIKDWKIIDIIIFCVYILFVSTTASIFNYTFMMVFSASLFMLGIIYLQKKTVLGRSFALVSFAFFAWQLYTLNLIGDFFALIVLLCPLIIWKIIELFIKSKTEKASFGIWDYITLFGSIIVMSFPISLLLIHLGSTYIILQTINFLIMFAVCYLQLKEIKWSKYLFLLILAIQLVCFILLTIQVDLNILAIAVNLLLVFGYQMYVFIAEIINAKKNTNSTK